MNTHRELATTSSFYVAMHPALCPPTIRGGRFECGSSISYLPPAKKQQDQRFDTGPYAYPWPSGIELEYMDTRICRMWGWMVRDWMCAPFHWMISSPFDALREISRFSCSHGPCALTFIVWKYGKHTDDDDHGGGGGDGDEKALKENEVANHS